MNNQLHKTVLRATRFFMTPIARFLLRTGIGFREFSEIAKLAFVDVASQDYGIRGRPTNISRVAVMTGLTRKEVKRIRVKLDTDDVTSDVRVSPGQEILHYWYQDTDFLGKDGAPVPIPYEGNGASFINLARRYGGDIPPGALRRELERVGAIEQTADGRIKALKRYFIPVEMNTEFVESVAHSLHDLASTIAHNAMHPGSDEGRIERYVFTRRLKKNSIPRFRRFAREHVPNFLEYIEDWISAHEVSYEDSKRQTQQRVGIGVYYFEED